jgi:hypothetical protein
MKLCNHTLAILTFLLPTLMAVLHAAEPPKVKEQLPDVRQWLSANYDEAFFQGRTVCGEEALTFWMQSAEWRRHPKREYTIITQFERLLTGDAQEVAKVNKEIVDECRRILADVNNWYKKDSEKREPVFWMLLALRLPDRLTPETHRVIRETLRALDLGDKKCTYINWMGTPGANGANCHGYITPLSLAPALIDDAKVREAGAQALRLELAHMNSTGDVQEFNVLESHWNGTGSWEAIKRYIPDPRLRRMARLISERLWVNRFLTWSPAIERITGPGSRMAPSEWLGCDNERALFATGLTRPIWINFFFPWDGWDSRMYRSGWPLAQTEACVPDLPAYLQDLAWSKSLPNLLQCRVSLRRHWPTYPKLSGVPEPDPMRPMKYVNYQGRGYTLGSTTSSWVVNPCVVAASAWWNNSRNPSAPLGSPERFCVLYPHYVFNGMSFLDKGGIYYDGSNGQPLKDEKGGECGPFIREFIDFGRVGTLQDRSTLLLSYTPKTGTHLPGQNLIKDKVQRASAAMFLFRWTDGTDGLFINREPVLSLPRELKPGDWWFIEDGDVYAAVRPLKATQLRGGKTTLEKRTRHIVLYQDNVAAANIIGIADADWVKARSGFIVEMGEKAEFGSFAQFQNKILAGRVTADEADGFTRHITYARNDRSLEMRWHSYTEAYATRKINGRDDPWTRFALSPEFAVSDSGQLAVKDATLATTPGKTLWLLACAPSRTWVAYQPNPDTELPLTLVCPAGRLTCERFPLGKIVVTQTDSGEIQVDADSEPVQLNLDTKVAAVSARFNGSAAKTTRAASGRWMISSK